MRLEDYNARPKNHDDNVMSMVSHHRGNKHLTRYLAECDLRLNTKGIVSGDSLDCVQGLAWGENLLTMV